MVAFDNDEYASTLKINTYDFLRLYMPVYVHVIVAIIFIAFLYCLRIVFIGLRDKYWQRRYQKLIAKRNAVADNIDDFKWNPLLDTDDVDAQKIREYLNSKK